MGASGFLRHAAAAAGLVALGIVAEAASAESGPPLAADAHFRAIRVDVAPLTENAGEPTASWVAHALPGPLNAAFASRLAPGDRSAPTLVVRIDSVFLGESDNGIFDATGADRARDNIQGVGIIVAPNGRTIASYPIFDVLYNYTGGSNYEVGTEQRRINELAASVAHWLPGQMGL
jgi:hypothetical protein